MLCIKMAPSELFLLPSRTGDAVRNSETNLPHDEVIHLRVQRFNRRIKEILDVHFAKWQCIVRDAKARGFVLQVPSTWTPPKFVPIIVLHKLTWSTSEPMDESKQLLMWDFKPRRRNWESPNLSRIHWLCQSEAVNIHDARKHSAILFMLQPVPRGLVGAFHES